MRSIVRAAISRAAVTSPGDETKMRSRWFTGTPYFCQPTLDTQYRTDFAGCERWDGRRRLMLCQRCLPKCALGARAAPPATPALAEPDFERCTIRLPA